MRNSLGLKNTGRWIIALLILLILFNATAFLIYQATNPAGDTWIQLWDYLGSDIFKVITVSLMLPLILFILEHRFKIAATVREKEQEERKDKRWECIEQTSEMWNQLWDLTSEVIYFKNRTNKEAAIEDLLIRIRNLTTSTEDVLNSWSHRFPNLPDEYEGAFLIFYNTELNSAETVAWCIRYSKSASEIRRLQNALKRIVGSINYLTHHSVIDVLKLSTQLIELKEANAPSGEQKETDSLIKQRVEHLKEWADAIEDKELEWNTPFSFVNTKSAKALRAAYRELREWALEHPGCDPAKEYEEYASFSDLFDQIQHEKAGPWFSKKFTTDLADWISLEYERISLLHQTERREPPSE